MDNNTETLLKNQHGRRVAIHWLLWVVFIYTIPSIWFIFVAGGLVPAISLLITGTLSLFSSGGDGQLSMSFTLLASGAVASLVYFVVAYGLSFPLAAIQRASLRSSLLLVIIAALVVMSLFPVYYFGGHNSGQAYSILTAVNDSPALFAIYVFSLLVVVLVLMLFQHWCVPLRGVWKNRFGRSSVLLLSAAFVGGFLYSHFAQVICLPAARMGMSSAQVCVGKAIVRGDFRPQDPDANAGNWFLKAAEQGNIEAARQLYDNGKKIKWLRMVAKSRDAAAQFELYQRLTRDRQQQLKDNEAIQWLQSAAKRGDADAQYILAMMQIKGDKTKGIAIDLESAMTLLNKAARQDHAEALTALVSIYQTGFNDIPLDLNKAIKLQKRLVRVQQAHKKQQDERQASEHVKLNKLKATRHQLAAQDPDTLKKLALQQFNIGSEESIQRGMSFLQRAAEQHDADAQFQLGRVYANGLYQIDKNNRDVVYWWSKAANNHHLDSLEALASVYANGQYDIEKDYQKAQDYIHVIIQIYQTHDTDSDEKSQQLGYWKDLLKHLEDEIKDYMGGEFVPLAQLRRYAAGGEPQAQFQLAQQLHALYGYHQNYGQETLEWYTKAAEGGHAQAQWQMFLAYNRGIVTSSTSDADVNTTTLLQKNNKEAVHYLKLAAANHHPQAMRELGLSYMQGRHSIRQDLEKALDIFTELVSAQEDDRYEWDLNEISLSSNLSALASVKHSLLRQKIKRRRLDKITPLVFQLLEISTQYKAQSRKAISTACKPNEQRACTITLSEKEKHKIATPFHTERDNKIDTLLENASEVDKKIWVLVKVTYDEIEHRSKAAFAALKQSKKQTYDDMMKALLEDQLELLQQRNDKIEQIKK